MATQSGTHSMRSASSDVNLVFPSTSTPRGTKGVNPGARIMSSAVYVSPPAVSHCNVWSGARCDTAVTPSAASDLVMF